MATGSSGARSSENGSNSTRDTTVKPAHLLSPPTEAPLLLGRGWTSLKARLYRVDDVLFVWRKLVKSSLQSFMLRWVEALKGLCGHMSQYIEDSGLGPWTQLLHLLPASKIPALTEFLQVHFFCHVLEGKTNHLSLSLRVLLTDFLQKPSPHLPLQVIVWCLNRYILGNDAKFSGTE